MKQQLSYKIISLILSLLLSGCGFHLRGTTQLPPQLHTLYLQSDSPYSQLTNQVRTSLQLSGIQLVSSSNLAPITLALSNENFSTYQTTVASSEQTRNYNATFSVSYTIIDSRGKVIYGPRSISDYQTITMQQNEVLENSNKLNIAKNDLIRSLAMKVIFQLSAKDTIAALEKKQI